MAEFRARMGENGRIVIPAACRRLLHVKPGEELIMHIEKDELRIFSLKHSLTKAQEMVQKYSKGKSLVKQLKTMREDEADE